jgi:hypothetical protein
MITLRCRHTITVDNTMGLGFSLKVPTPHTSVDVEFRAPASDDLVVHDRTVVVDSHADYPAAPGVLAELQTLIATRAAASDRRPNRTRTFAHPAHNRHTAEGKRVVATR